MQSKLYWVLLVAAVLAVALIGAELIRADSGSPGSGPNKLAVLWTSGDPDVAHKVCLMYTHAAKKAKWFDEVELIVWGPSSRLLAADKELQAKVRAMIADGVQLKACIVCADMYGVSDHLRELGVDVKPMGRPLTAILKSDAKVLTF